MVTKKTIADRLDTNPSQSNQLPPYPVSPNDRSKESASATSVYSTDLNTSSTYDLIDVNEVRTKSRRDSDVSSHGTWDSDDGEDGTAEENGQEQALKGSDVAGQTPHSSSLHPAEQQQNSLPSILKPGPSSAQIGKMPVRAAPDPVGNPWANELSRKPLPQSNNPYLQQRASPDNSAADKTHDKKHASSWDNLFEQSTTIPAVPSSPPPPAPAANTTTSSMNPSLPPISFGSSPFSNPFQSAPAPSAPSPYRSGHSPLPAELPAVKTPSKELDQLSLTDNAQSTLKEENERQYGIPRHMFDKRHSAQSPPRYELPDHSPSASPLTPPPVPPHPPPTLQPWQTAQSGGPSPPAAPPYSMISNTNNQSDHNTSLIDQDLPMSAPPVPSTPPTGLGVTNLPKTVPLTISPPPPQSNRTPDSIPDTPNTVAKRQRSEHYQIKQINWKDASTTGPSTEQMRRSPILTQNANGPCPLLALVNALVLTTPANVDTALIDALRTREQVSLGLLLDAVFDELMSGRRGDSATELPDVSELYSFLLALHTGMNVNPRFVGEGATHGAQNGIHSGGQAHSKAGSFEETKEMRLYSTFNLPLIHGWLPYEQDEAYQAFARCAQTFEDAQNVQFNESELEEKMHAVGLSDQEAQSLYDIHIIKQFLSTWPTQLTVYGLETISSSLQPGQFAILFRNDHFSTVYKEPVHGALMTLVTDAGYSSHEEIVWESLVDVNGSASEMFSGDFRTVSHDGDARNDQMPAINTRTSSWESGQSRNRYQNLSNARRPSAPQRRSGSDGAPSLPGPRPYTLENTSAQVLEQSRRPDLHHRSPSEQEDHDLALALQLQEEEEAQQRQADEQRRREQELTDEFLSADHTQNGGRQPVIPPRRGGGRRPTNPRPAVNRPTNEAEDADAPPTYEQSASDRPYRESGSTAPPTQGNPLSTYEALRRRQEEQQSAYAQQQSSSPPIGPRTSSSNRIQRQNGRDGTLSGAYGVAAMGGRHPRQSVNSDYSDERCSVM